MINDGFSISLPQTMGRKFEVELRPFYVGTARYTAVDRVKSYRSVYNPVLQQPITGSTNLAIDRQMIKALVLVDLTHLSMATTYLEGVLRQKRLRTWAFHITT